MKKYAVLAIAGLWGGMHWLNTGSIDQPSGMLVRDPPLQENLAAPLPKLDKKGYAIKPLARFSLSARVLSRADYRFDAGAELVPIDLALGWGKMSDTAVIKQLSISQSGRWWSWYADRLPASVEEINQSAANMHLIPANGTIGDLLDRTRVGQIVEIRGYLVEAKNQANGSIWRSSLSRNDTGNGACELIWVEQFRFR